MIIATLLAGAALQAAFAPPPPAPPLPPAPPAAAEAPLPPLPPAPPHFMNLDGRGMQVITRNDGKGRVTVIAGDTSASASSERQEVLSYDADGRHVRVYADHPVTRAEADKLIGDATAEGARARASGALAREEGARARAQADVARQQGRAAAEAGRQAAAQARIEGQKAREYAQVIIKQMKDENGNWRFDSAGGPPHTMVFRQGEFPGAGDIKALRDEVHALRVEMDELRAQLKGGLSH